MLTDYISIRTMAEITLRFKYTEDEVVKTTQKFFFQGIRKIPIIIYVFGLVAGIYYYLYLNDNTLLCVSCKNIP